MATFSDSIRFAQQDRLVRLLQLRPDLASPSPGTLYSLAARATNSHSMTRAMAGLDSSQLQVLESVVVLATLHEQVTSDLVCVAILGAPSSSDAPGPDQGTDTQDPRERQTILDAIAHLSDLALLWAPEPEILRGAAGIEEAFDRFPAGFGPLGVHPTPALPLPTTAPVQASAILQAMLWGPPVGLVPANLFDQQNSHAEPATSGALRWLLTHHYLELIDPTHVSLPRQVAYGLRQYRTHRGLATPPAVTSATGFVADPQIQTESASAAADLVRQVAELISAWEAEPSPALRSGGLPVREVKQLSNALDLTAAQLQMISEFALAAKLVRASDSAAQVFAPTVQVDAWLQKDLTARWEQLVLAWLNSSRMTWQIGQLDDRAQTIAALHPANHQTGVVRLRAAVLKVLANHPGQSLSAAEVSEHLAWQTPRALPPMDWVAGILAEAAALGVTGAGALLPGLLVPAESGTGWAFSPAKALGAALPEPVQEIFIQGDLTAMVPGWPVAALDALLSECAQVESRGGALTVRFTPASITKAFDSGRSAQGLLQELQMYSLTPIPQPLEYLILDVARNHGRVRVGSVSTYIRISDPVIMASVLGSPAFAAAGVFALGSDVLGATADVSTVLALLREAKLAPAVEDHTGQIITADRLTPQTRLPVAPARSEATLGLPAHPVPAATILADKRLVPSADLSQLVGQLVSATDSEQPMVLDTAVATVDSAIDTVPPAVREAPAQTGQTLLILREAIDAGQELWLELADSKGRITRRKLKPLSIDSGRLRAADLARESELTVSVHRIAGAQAVDNEN